MPLWLVGKFSLCKNIVTIHEKLSRLSCSACYALFASRSLPQVLLPGPFPVFLINHLVY